MNLKQGNIKVIPLRWGGCMYSSKSFRKKENKNGQNFSLFYSHVTIKKSRAI
jgi:hypothetical protein